MSAAMDAARAAIDQGARVAVARIVKARARRFLAHPRSLEILHPGLSLAHPRQAIAIGEAMLSTFAHNTPRMVGFGGEATAVNARGVILYARCVRRFGARLEVAA